MSDIENLSTKPGDLLLVKTKLTHLPQTKIKAIKEALETQIEELGLVCKVAVVDSGVDVQLIPDIGAILQRMDALTESIERMAQVNQGMVDLFVEALADETGTDEMLATYLNGDPIN